MLVLPAHEVHLFRVRLDTLGAQLAQYAATLNADERARAARFYFAHDQQRFIVARGCLRMILSRYLRVAAAELDFGYNTYGKPSLASPYTGSGLTFNLAHSGEFALYALARQRQIGVDLEQIRSNMDYEQLAGQVFSPAEQQSLQRVPAAQRLEAFFHGWTRKEAYIKAQGLGLSLPLDQFTVTLAPDEPPRLVSTAHAPAEAVRWSLQAITPAPGYVGAVVTEGRDWTLRWQVLALDEAMTR